MEKSAKVAKKTVGTGLTAAGVENELDDTSEDENDTNTNDPKQIKEFWKVYLDELKDFRKLQLDFNLNDEGDVLI